MNNLLTTGIMLLFIAVILIFISSFKNAEVKSAGGIFIGPFPVFGFFSDLRMFYILISIAVILFISWLIFHYL